MPCRVTHFVFTHASLRPALQGAPAGAAVEGSEAPESRWVLYEAGELRTVDGCHVGTGTARGQSLE